MGSPKSEQEHVRKHFVADLGDWIAGGEIQHRVDLTQGFFLGIHQVTQAQWHAVIGHNPGDFKGEDLPVESASWLDTVAFCNNLSTHEGKNTYYHRVGNDIEFAGGDGYRLPTEAEWEYACRAGTTSAFCFGNDAAKLGEYAWYDNNAAETTHRVGHKKANAWGLFDMYGNVYEWCQDCDEDYRKNSPGRDPGNATVGILRVMRGGSWGCSATACRSAYRDVNEPGTRGSFLGFRLARSFVE